MATYSTAQSNSSYGNVTMSINVYRGDITGRTENAVSFNFGVCFTPTSKNTTNSVAAWYGGVQRFAYANPGYGYDSCWVRANKDTTYHAYYSDRNTLRDNTAESLCFSFYTAGISATTTSVNVTVGVGWSDWAGSNNGSLTFAIPIPQYHGSINRGTTTITDNFNNSFTLSATKGANGVNNVTGGPTNLKWGYSTSYDNTFTNGDTKPLTISGTGNTRTVYASSTTTATHGSSLDATTSKNITQYIAPSNPGTPALAASSFKNNRLTIKQNWTYNWDAAEQANDSSPVAGYRIRIYKNGALVKGVVVGSGSTVTKGTGNNEWIDRDGGTNCSVTFDPGPSGFDFKPGDTVKISVFAYAKNGLGQITWYVGSTYYHLWSGNGSTPVESAESTVQNSGIMRVRPAGSWKEGVVWVKVNNAWVEAEVVYAKDSNNWKEST